MVNEKIQIRKRKNGRLVKDLEQIQTEVLLAATCDERDQKRRLERMEELKKMYKYSIARICRKILQNAIETGRVRAEEFI